MFGIEVTAIIGKQTLSKITSVNLPALQIYQKTLVLKGFSPNTIRNYCTEFAQLLHLLKNVPVDTLTTERLRSYFLYCHSVLHHSYATHLLEYGTDIGLIQKLMGHNDTKTTLQHTRVANSVVAKVQSPLDHLLKTK